MGNQQKQGQGQGQGQGQDTRDRRNEGAQGTGGGDQREALARSQKRATCTEPENFRDRATDDKVVHIGADCQDDPIQGIDPKESPTPER